MDIVNYYLGEDTVLNSTGADANPFRPGPAQPPPAAAASIVFGGALTYSGVDAAASHGQWAYAPVTGTVLDVTA
jgi:hypothetical protein